MPEASKILVILLVAVSLFALVSCNGEHESAEIFVSGGKIHVNFDKKQAVETKSVSFGGSQIVNYDVCTSADLSIEPLEALGAIKDHINGFTLVSTDKTRKHFVAAFTLDGALLDTVAAILETLTNVLPESISITTASISGPEAGEFTGTPTVLSFTMSGTEVELALDFDFVVEGLEFDTDFSLDGFTLAPIYLTEDLLGLASDAVSGNMWKSIAPLTIFTVTYKDGKTACSTILDKVDAKLNIAKTSVEGTYVVTNCEPGVRYYVCSVFGNWDGFTIVDAEHPTFTCYEEKFDDIFVVAKKSGSVSGFWLDYDIDL